MREFERKRLAGSHVTPRFSVTIEDPDTHALTHAEYYAVSVDALKSQLRAQYGPRALITYTRRWEGQR